MGSEAERHAEIKEAERQDRIAAWEASIERVAALPDDGASARRKKVDDDG